MKRIDKNMNMETTSNSRTVTVFIIIGLGFGLCVGYTLAKLAHWMMNLH